MGVLEHPCRGRHFSTVAFAPLWQGVDRVVANRRRGDAGGRIDGVEPLVQGSCLGGKLPPPTFVTVTKGNISRAIAMTDHACEPIDISHKPRFNICCSLQTHLSPPLKSESLIISDACRSIPLAFFLIQ